MEYRVSDNITTDHAEVILAAMEAYPVEYRGDNVWETRRGDDTIIVRVSEDSITVIAHTL